MFSVEERAFRPASPPPAVVQVRIRARLQACRNGAPSTLLSSRPSV